MTWFTGLLAYFLIWWVALFAVLPWGIRHSYDNNPAERAAGAPVNPSIKKKFLITTIVATIIFIIIYAIGETGLIDFREISLSMRAEDLE